MGEKVKFRQCEKIKTNVVPLSEGLGKNEIEPLYFCECCGRETVETVNVNGKELCSECRKAMSEWHDITTATTAPSGFKWQRNGPMFVKGEDGKYVRNKEYEQRLVKIGCDKMLKGSECDRGINVDGLIDTSFGEESFSVAMEKISIARAKAFDKAIFGEIYNIATENGIETHVLLNEAFVVEAIRNRTPVLPGISGDGFYCCPTCGDSVDKSKKYCGSCGQAIEWRYGSER